MVVGTIIGTSIFVQPSEITALVPSVSGILLVWIVSGVLTLFGALVCAELASIFTRSGGVYVYLKEAYSPALGFLWGWAKERTMAKFEEWGLENIHEERFSFGQGWEVVRFNAHMVEPQVMPIIGYPRSWSSSTEGVVNAEVAYLTIETEADLDKYRGELEGKVVFLQPIRDVEMLESDLVLRMTPELKEEASRTPVGAATGGGPRATRTPATWCPRRRSPSSTTTA